MAIVTNKPTNDLGLVIDFEVLLDCGWEEVSTMTAEQMVAYYGSKQYYDLLCEEMLGEGETAAQSYSEYTQAVENHKATLLSMAQNAIDWHANND